MKLNRYNRQTILKGFGLEGQQKLANAKVLIIGAGGLGVPVLTYLNAMGVGKIGVVDNDKVSLTNLHRQVLYSEAEVGQPKVSVAIKKLKAQNSETELIGYQTFLSVENALEIISDYDIVVDTSDNFPTRYLVNDTCVILKKPFVYGALHGYEGQVSVFNFQAGPTYRCLFPTMPKEDEVPNCNEHGVLGIIPGIIGNLQALETIKVITGIGEVLSGKLLLFDGLSQRTQKIGFRLNPDNLKRKHLEKSYEFDCLVPIKSIEAIGIKNLLADGNIQLIDVRTEAEFQKRHLDKAKNIPLDILETRCHEIQMENPVYFICQSGIRSRKAIFIMQNLFPDKEFINVEGGMNHINTYANTY